MRAEERQDRRHRDDEKDARGGEDRGPIGGEASQDAAGLLAFPLVSVRRDLRGERAGGAEVAFAHRGLRARQRLGFFGYPRSLGQGARTIYQHL